MDFDERYRIIASRDPRFDGQFITAVRSTGIYCRPSCPARTPKAVNVTFYETSAAAHEAGYRACKRCLPEAVPGTPAWNLRDDLAARAMRLIADGLIEREGVDGLSRRLGYSSRHLTRVLRQELGAGPLALSRAHRAQTARTLLTSTDLPMADIAFAAGFTSIRQFNDTVGEVFELTPTEIRARQSRANVATPGSIALSLPYREPFDAAGVFAWLAARAIPGVEIAAPDSYTRSLALPGGPAWFTVRHSGSRLLLEAHLTALGDLPVLVARIRRLFDLDADPVAIDAALAAVATGAGVDSGGAASHDTRIRPSSHAAPPEIAAGGLDAARRALTARIARVPGIRLPGAVDAHEMLFRAIIGQQITVSAARTMLHRLAVAAGSPFESTETATETATATGAGLAGGTPSAPTLLFPTAAQIAEHAGSVLYGPRAKIATVVAVAEALVSGELELSSGDDAAELRRRLTALPGIGDWTAGYLAMRVLGNPDILLTGDVAVRAGARSLGFPDAPRELAGWAADYAPWRSYLCLHLWGAAADAATARRPARPGPGPAPADAPTPEPPPRTAAPAPPAAPPPARRRPASTPPALSKETTP
ncbi:helix-turn-helix domain-containing protein [Herbiconiux sp. CPCC 205763]|uniref:DNA-3-methyladenine glycosylase II n=1 Tax=Herbiconiux aconitum TaxID=2970913 RepID=A0ABT2GUP5_9MICO|nr:AlkA N-terminal domain-containing protein [Herbiconiux aconitum]MCS5719939.1 helix-turn-helix domain-containing protein [Herbiconiux aconitum]